MKIKLLFTYEKCKQYFTLYLLNKRRKNRYIIIFYTKYPRTSLRKNFKIIDQTLRELYYTT